MYTLVANHLNSAIVRKLLTAVGMASRSPNVIFSLYLLIMQEHVVFGSGLACGISPSG